ncbi:MAG: hypothetical protein AB1449_04565 [Chloroflexota bacterium]
MARKRSAPLSRYERRRLRTQQILFTIIAILVIASFIVSLVAR